MPRRTVSRRGFLLSTVLATACAPALRLTGRKRYDVILRGGTVFDGTGAEGVEGDVAIDRGRIAAVGPALGDDAKDILDVRGLAVAPGFVDIHSHGDGTMFADPNVESVVRQGITTVIVGQDGSSRGPSRPAPANADDDEEGGYRSFGDFLKAVRRLPPAVNVASMVGLGTARAVVIGDDDRPAAPDELRRMTEIVESALRDGACGASSGLEYIPNAFASRDELVALCRPLAARRLPYATHMRNEDDRLLEAIDEAIGVAQGAGCPLQISHLKTQGTRNWGKIDEALGRIERAAEAGLDVAYDRYPYVAYQTGLSNLFPTWSRDGGTDAFLARLADPEQATRIRADTLAKVEGLGGWDNVMISSVADDADRPAEGQRVGSYAASLGADPYDTAVGLLQRSKGGVGMVGFAMSEDNIARFLAHPKGMVCSDGGAYAIEGPARRGHPHPRGLGSFPRVLATYVRERKALTLAQAIHKMSGLPASRVRLADRGRLAVGSAADVVVFDPATVKDEATFTDPFRYPTGIPTVLVNGAFAMREGARIGKRTGKVVRPAPIIV